ncbi:MULTISPECIES: methionine ABC transporter permease [unclassified Leifsonia]|uniref:methionine ABC transporter permease n=1 Tax=unclassified Leifsonia TaxID=2663824 RepID=UPI0006F816ED|nr:MULTISPECIES: methionine ABC transporter permease [unclassified Leifsonia]KQX07488.1 methionine ABC transporter ATP-binding protein [Leifsonia sp. Root1293]KRA11770.1 methionine ABC transporter ATP-binding protein [Leifsonia sp. Root60]
MDALIELQDEFWKAAGETLYMVSITLLIGGAAGLLMGLILYATRAGSLLPNKAIFVVLNVVINFFRPIPFIIFIAAVQPLSRMIIGTGIGINAVIFALSLAASFAIARIVEQNLVTVSPGVIEAARSMGAGPYRILGTIVIPEALGPLILGYTFIFVAIVDMSAVAGLIGGGGLGYFAQLYGYRQFEPVVTWAAVLLIVVFVQIAQFVGNKLARVALRR